MGGYHEQHIQPYGIDNEMRLTGLHETCSITEFRYGVSDRGRINSYTNKLKEIKRLFRRQKTESNCDPYVVSQKVSPNYMSIISHNRKRKKRRRHRVEKCVFS